MMSGDGEGTAPSAPAGTEVGEVPASDLSDGDATATVGAPPVPDPPRVADPSTVVDPSTPEDAPAVPQMLAPAAPPLVDDPGVIADMNVERGPALDPSGAPFDRSSLAGASRGDEPVAPPAAQPAQPIGQHEPLALRIVARPSELSAIRQAMRHWLAEAGVPTQVAEDVVLACGEAAANVIEHAYGGSGEGWMDIKVALVNGTLVASISDHGRWQPHGSGDGRGRGIRLIGVLMDQVDLHSDDAGTKVTMRKALDDPLS